MARYRFLDFQVVNRNICKIAIYAVYNNRKNILYVCI